MAAVDLTLSFGQRAVLSGVSLEFCAGNVTALLGPTGSGKTTLLRTLNRMNDKVTGFRHEGDVLLDGRSIWKSGMELMTLRRRVGMLFQRPNPFPMSIMDNVLAGVRAHKMAPKATLRAIAEQRLRDVGLWDAVSARLKDSPFRLSGGQQQLLCLARALAIAPDVLLLDEPTSSLDLGATAALARLLRGLADDGLAVVLVVHDLALAAAVADEVVVVSRGATVCAGAPAEILTPAVLADVWHVSAGLTATPGGHTALHVDWLGATPTPTTTLEPR
jgi:phosphate transport system ATP-binding protein